MGTMLEPGSRELGCDEQGDLTAKRKGRVKSDSSEAIPTIRGCERARGLLEVGRGRLARVPTSYALAKANATVTQTKHHYIGIPISDQTKSHVQASHKQHVKLISWKCHMRFCIPKHTIMGSKKIKLWFSMRQGIRPRPDTFSNCAPDRGYLSGILYSFGTPITIVLAIV
jgi:hypothetical protein